MIVIIEAPDKDNQRMTHKFVFKGKDIKNELLMGDVILALKSIVFEATGTPPFLYGIFFNEEIYRISEIKFDK
jgi:hypothetical protein